jgi:hypothetical protein
MVSTRGSSSVTATSTAVSSTEAGVAAVLLNGQSAPASPSRTHRKPAGCPCYRRRGGSWPAPVSIHAEWHNRSKADSPTAFVPLGPQRRFACACVILAPPWCLNLSPRHCGFVGDRSLVEQPAGAVPMPARVGGFFWAGRSPGTWLESAVPVPPAADAIATLDTSQARGPATG